MERISRIRVLVIDDSAYSRRSITRMLEASPLVEVVGWAADGEEALRKTIELAPDLITLDLEMPRMDGFTYLRLVMARQPTPVLVVSGRSAHAEVFRALDLGAVDFVLKPRSGADLASIEQELIRKVHSIRDLRIEKVQDRLGATPTTLGRSASKPDHAPRVVAIGSSTGGPSALVQVLGAFEEAPDCAFLIAQHMPEGFTRGFAGRLDRLTPLAAREAAGGEEPAPGTALVAPGGRHLELETAGGVVRTRLMQRSDDDRHAPEVDRLLTSAAKHYGADLMAVVLTGMGSDGRVGARAVKEAGGTVVVESEETAVIFGMPQQVIREGLADAVLPLSEIASVIRSGVER